MIDRDAEIAKMVDEYLVKTSRFGHAPTEKHSAAGKRYNSVLMGKTAEYSLVTTEDYALRVDESPAEDVERRGVIGSI